MDYSESPLIGYLDFMYGVKITPKLETLHGTFKIPHKLPKKYDLNIQPCIPNIPNCPFRDYRHSTLEIVNECNLNLPKIVPLHIHTQN
jgi:hypothetical protein